MILSPSESGKLFISTARYLINHKLPNFSKKDKSSPAYWFEPEDMTGVSGFFNLIAAYNNSGSHWRLLLEVNKNREALVYDPYFSDKDSYHIYRMKLPDDSVTFPSPALSREFGIDCLNLSLTPEGEQKRLDQLIEKNYQLYLPSHFQKEKIQDDSCNCGPLTLYAALVADEKTERFKGKAKVQLAKGWTSQDLLIIK